MFTVYSVSTHKVHKFFEICSKGGSSQKFLAVWQWEGVDCRAPENKTATIMSVHCFLMELKLCNVIICIDGKTGSWEKTGAGPAAPGYNRTWIRYPANKHATTFIFLINQPIFWTIHQVTISQISPNVSKRESIFMCLMAFL